MPQENIFRSGAAPLALVPLLACLLLTGCAGSLKSHYQDVDRAVQERSGARVDWTGQPVSEAALAAAVAPYLAQPLTVASAVRITLVNNHELLATLRDVDISRAALVQAMLPSNPTLFVRQRYPIDFIIDDTNSEFSVTKDLMDLFTWGIRRRMATRQLEQTKDRVADEALTLIRQVRETYYTLQGQMQARDLLRRRVEEMEAAVGQTRRQFQAGQLAEADLLGDEGSLALARSQLALAEGLAARYRAKLNQLMGLSGAQADAWTMAGALPPLPAAEPSLDQLETQALARRLDLAAARRQTEALSEALKLQRRTRLTQIFNFGIDYERALGGQLKLWGPYITVNVPIFDWGQARIASAKAYREQSQLRASALETAIRAQVRDAREQLLAARANAAIYRDEILPRQRREMELRQGAGAPGPAARMAGALSSQATLEAGYITALRDYWVARAQLAQAAGGGIPGEPQASESIPPAPAAMPGR